MSRIAETLRISLTNTPGTEVAETWGKLKKGFGSPLNHEMVASGMSAERVASAIAGADARCLLDDFAPAPAICWWRFRPTCNLPSA